jgi:hypothetical protein
MRNTALTVALLVLSVSLCAIAADAQETKPIEISLWTPVQIHDENTSIKGFRLNILYGVNADVTGVDIGLVNRNTGVFKGFQWGLVGIAGDFTGWQNTAVNITNGKFVGLQGSLYPAIYNSGVTTEGVQFGLVNRAESFEGLQLGLFNVTDTLRGLQIGLLNVVGSREKWKYLPIVSWSF